MKNDSVKNKLLGGAAVLGAGTFIAKLLGAVYRVPLTTILGGTGIGLYQMVFPVYTVLLDFSGAGAPSALSKLIAGGGEEKNLLAKKYLSVSLKLFSALGAIFSLFMLVFSKTLAIAQGNENAFLSYAFLSPAVFFVCLVTPFRGYFQGLMDMKPTALSQITEQLVKLCFGLLFAKLFAYDSARAAAGAAFAITISEAVAALYLFVVYKKRIRSEEKLPPLDRTEAFSYCKKLIKTAVPVTLIGIIVPLSSVADSFIAVNILNGYRTDATALYGLFSGVAMTIIGLPVAICYGIAATAIPAVSGSCNENERRKNGKRAIVLTVLFSLPCAAFLYFFSPFTINFLFRSLPSYERETAASLLKLLSPAVVLLSLLQTQNAVLIGRGRLYSPMIAMIFGVAVKTVSEIFLIKNPAFNVYGLGAAVIACYLVADLINFITLSKKPESSESQSMVKNESATDKLRGDYRPE